MPRKCITGSFRRTDRIPWIVRANSKGDFTPASLNDLLWLEAALEALIAYFSQDFRADKTGEPRPVKKVYRVPVLRGTSQVSLELPVLPPIVVEGAEAELISEKDRLKADQALNKAEQQIVKGDWKGVLRTCLDLLKWLPEIPAYQADAWSHLGSAYAMLRDFDQSYQAFSRALEYDPEDAGIWYNRAVAARFTFRMGQSLKDMEHAVALTEDKSIRRTYQKELDLNRRLVKDDLRKRGPKFTLEQLIEQQETFQGVHAKVDAVGEFKRLPTTEQLAVDWG